MGLIAMSACLRGDINETILADRYERSASGWLTNIRICLAKIIFSLRCKIMGWIKTRLVLPQIRRMSAETGIPLVVTNDAHYLTLRRRSRARNSAVHPNGKDNVRHRTGCASPPLIST